MTIDDLPRRALKRVERTFAFFDISGFTAYTDREGDAAAYDVIRNFRNAVRQVALLGCHEISGFVEPIDLVRLTPAGDS